MLSPLLERYRLWRLKRQATRILHGFDDRQLRDIGTFRDSIELYVEEHATLDVGGQRPAPHRRSHQPIRLNVTTQVMS